MILSFDCSKIDFILKIVAYLLKILRLVVPIILIVLITFDMAKAMTSGDEKKSKEATSKAVKRFIYAIIVFLVPTLVKLFFNFFAQNTSSDGYDDANSWRACAAYFN